MNYGGGFSTVQLTTLVFAVSPPAFQNTFGSRSRSPGKERIVFLYVRGAVMLVPSVRPISHGGCGIGKYNLGSFIVTACFVLFCSTLATLLLRLAGLFCPKLFNAPEFEDRTT